MPSKDGPKLSPTTARDSLFFNAFEDAAAPTTISSGNNTTSWQTETVKSPRKGKSTLRRRGSDSTLSSFSWNGELRMSARPLGHSRSQTQGRSQSDRHPLVNTTFGSDTMVGQSDITRPHLSRIMRAWESPAGSDTEGGGKGSSDAGSFLESPPEKADEKTVLVHEVSWNYICNVAKSWFLNISRTPGVIERFVGGGRAKIWNHNSRTSKSQPSLGLRLHSLQKDPLHTP